MVIGKVKSFILCTASGVSTYFSVFLVLMMSISELLRITSVYCRYHLPAGNTQPSVCVCVWLHKCVWCLLGFHWSVGIALYQVTECIGTGAIFKWKCVCVYMNRCKHPLVLVRMYVCVDFFFLKERSWYECRAEFLSAPPVDRWIDGPIGNQW